MTAVAVNVTEVPAQIVPAGEAAIVTLTGLSGFTVMVIAFDVAGFPLTQTISEVIVQVTTSVLFNAPVVNVALLNPAGVPLTNHA